MKSIPLLRLDTADDGKVRELRGNRASESDGEKQSVLRALFVHLVGDFPGSFPFFRPANDILLLIDLSRQLQSHSYRFA